MEAVDLKTMMDQHISQMTRKNFSKTKRQKLSHHAVLDDLKCIGQVKKLVPHDLKDRQNLSRFKVCFLLLRNPNDPFWYQIVKMDRVR